MKLQKANTKRLQFKLQVVQEIEQGLLTTTGALEKYEIQAASTVRTWLKKYGNFDYQYTIQKRNV